MRNATVSNEQLDTFLAKYGMNFDVEMTPTFIEHGDIRREVGYVAVRTDTHEALGHGGLTKGFHPIQNRDAFRVLTELSGVADIELRHGGMWGNGAGLYAQVSLGDMQVGNGGDMVGKYLTFVNSHDGSKGLQILVTPYRYFCKNQIARSLAQANAEQKRGKNVSFTVRHTASAETRLQELMETVKIVDGQFTQTQDMYNKLAQTKINEEYVKEVLTQLFPLKHEENTRGRTIWNNNIMGAWKRFNYCDGGRTERNTAWNLYNAVQGTIQHDSKDTSSKEKSTIMGVIAERSAEALEVVNAVCSSEHVPASVMSEIEALMAV